MQGRPHLHSATLGPAKKIAMAVLGHFRLESYEAYRGFISDSSADMFDRGQEVDVYGVLGEFSNKGAA